MTATADRPGDVASGTQDVIGTDRDVDGALRRLLTEGSVIVVGPLGSGKSYFTRAVVAALRAQGTAPAVVRAAVPLATLPFGAIDAAADPRLDDLRNGSPAHPADPLVVVVDDAHALDPESLGLLSRALYTGRARALLAVTVDPGGETPTPEALTELWLRGEATRYDLHELDDRTAGILLAEFLGPAALDTVTGAVLFARSGGSRMLLHELAIDAAAELSAGRDPLDPGHEVPPGSRLSDAAASTLADLSTEQCLALAVLGRIRGVEFATACRFVEPDVLESLILRRTVHADDSPARPLSANRLLAREAERRLAPGQLERALDATVIRALATPANPAGGPVDRLIASRWHSMRGSVPGPEETPPAVRSRILASAARWASAEGRPDLALAFAGLGLGLGLDATGAERAGGGCAPLLLETSRAHAGLRRFAEAYAVLPEHAAGIEPDDLRRLVRWWGTLVTWMPEGHTLDQISAWLAEGDIDDPSILCELDVLRAESACLAMDWRAAARLADGVLALDEAHTLAKLRCAIISGFSTAQLEGFAAARPMFDEAARLNRDPVTGRPVHVIAELSVLCFEAMAGILSGFSVPGHHERLRRATLLAAERDERGGLALAGIVSGIVLGLTTHDESRADREFRAALQRFDRIEFAVWRPLIAYLRVSILARLGRPDQARSVITGLDEHLMAHHRIYTYSRFSAQAEVSAADGDLTSAQRAVRAAIDVSALGTAGLHDRDLFQLSRFSGVPLDDLRLRRMQRAAARGGAAGPGPGAAVAACSSPLPPVGTATDAGGPPVAPFSPELSELTEREHEIALLVARQLSNKEIAQRLFLSVRTVESHVYTARGKVGARSRRELGRVVMGLAAPGVDAPRVEQPGGDR